jgi:hypothetical protein
MRPDLCTHALPYGYHARRAGGCTRTRIYHLREKVMNRSCFGSREGYDWVSGGVPVTGRGFVAPRELG